MSVAAAWENVVYDCGCPDIYYCPAAKQVECPRHSGFTTCCNRPAGHLPVPQAVRSDHPRPLLPLGLDE